jgi:hypothetical protein
LSVPGPGSRVLFACLVLSALGAPACGELPEIKADSCGNRVVEPGEACDGFGRGDASCRPAGSVLQCQLDCSVPRAGDRPACPPDWGCSAEDVCRPATGHYIELSPPILAGATSLRSGDFDGDGRGDLIELESKGVDSNFRVRFFDRNAALEHTWSRPFPVNGLEVVDVSSDGLSDLVLASGVVGVLVGQPDRVLLSETYPSYFLPDTKFWVAARLAPDEVSENPPLLVVADAGKLALLRPDEKNHELVEAAQLDGRIDDFAGEPVLGDLFEDPDRYPCLDVGFAMRGADEVMVYSMCERDRDTGELVFRAEPGLTRVPLRPSAPIDKGPLFADVDGDHHLDLLIGAEGVLHVAFGDGEQLGSARPLPFNFSDPADPRMLAMPIATGDISRDGAADLIYADGIVLSKLGGSRDRLDHEDFRSGTGRGWTSALVADFNANGIPDLVAASDQTSGIEFRNGAGDGRFNAFIIPTTRPVAHLVAGEFDGDLITDFAFSELGASGEWADVLVAFGEPAGPPSAPIKAARVANVTQLGTIPADVLVAVEQLMVGYTSLDAEQNPGGALAWLFPDGARNFVSLVELTSFASDSSLETAIALGVTTGTFRAPGQIDALSLAVRSFPDPEIGVWMLPDLRHRSGRPLSLGWPFDLRVAIPLHDDVSQYVPGAVMHRAGDFDADGLDELVFAASDASLEHCLVSIARVQGDDPIELVADEPVLLEPGCGSAGQLEVVDMDDDAAPDIIALTGDAGAGVLRVLWNDGLGRFSADAQTLIDAAEEPPRGFTVFRSSVGAERQLAYVTDTRVHLLRSPAGTREFPDAPLPVGAPFAGGRAITAADLDGDGIHDLAVGSAREVRVLRAELEP